MGNLDLLITSTGDYLEKLAFNSLRAYLTINAPWTKAPILKQIIDSILSKLLNILFTRTEYGVYVLGVVTIVNEQKKEFNKAIDSNDQEQILQAAKKFISLKSP